MVLRNILSALAFGEITFLLYSIYSSPVQPTQDEIRNRPEITAEYHQKTKRVLDNGVVVGLVGASVGGLVSLFFRGED